ncbi:adenosine deaminase [Candidatus Vecturithrix granuli]|uniref:Adenosine deaminase n=1 Tax=Vecturithrix granuli TaxID=1499967 RepID=A0A081C200_VECG1|nr:adenosine deaminase [Candidatus Vecturithrix granuli]
MYEFVGCFIRNSSDLRYVISHVVKQLKAQHIVYAELTIAVADYLEHGMKLPEVMDCLAEAAQQPGIHIQWIVDLGRMQGSQAALDLLNRILTLECEHIAGITLGGSECVPSPQQFTEVYHLAREHGLGVTIHAGETLGPEYIWQTLQVLHVQRIGHGVRVIEDQQLMKELVAQSLPLDICPTSTIWNTMFPTTQAYPLKSLIEAGVPITINTDLPTFFDTTLADEYRYIAMATGIQADTIFEMLKNGFRYAFLPQEEIAAYLYDLEHAWQQLVHSF